MRPHVTMRVHYYKTTGYVFPSIRSSGSHMGFSCYSMEEAKKNMYAFSTTTYTGFQCTVSEETSEKFKGV